MYPIEWTLIKGLLYRIHFIFLDDLIIRTGQIVESIFLNQVSPFELSGHLEGDEEFDCMNYTTKYRVYTIKK
jgi:hypothetical protein